MATIKFRRGTSFPAGLTAGEPAFRTDTDQFYIHDGVTAVWVGALISTGDLTTGSTLTVPTQSAVKAYVDANIAGGSVTSVAGVTGAVLLAAGTGITLSTASKTITITNTGVHSLTGTSNQIAVSGSTGAVTLSLPSTVTVPGALNVTTNLTVTGNLTVNGTTTTVNSDVMTVDDPVIVLGLSGGLPLTVSDGGKSKGIAYSWYDTGSSTGKTGFFGIRNSSVSGQVFGVYESVDLTSDAVGAGATLSTIESHGLYLKANQNISVPGVHALASLSTSPSVGARLIYFADHAGYVMTPSTLGTPGYIIKANGLTAQPTWIDPNSSGFTAFAATQLATARNIALTGNVTATGVAFDGTAGITLTTTIGTGVVTNAMLVNSGFTLGSTNITLGSTTTTLAGLSSVTATTFTGSLSGTATTATNVTLTEATSSNTSDLYPTFIASGATGGLLIDATAQSGLVALSYRPSTGTLTAYKVEAIVDGGSY
jgi:hypothetical protein